QALEDQERSVEGALTAMLPRGNTASITTSATSCSTRASCTSPNMKTPDTARRSARGSGIPTTEIATRLRAEVAPAAQAREERAPAERAREEATIKEILARLLVLPGRRRERRTTRLIPILGAMSASITMAVLGPGILPVVT